MSEKRPRERKSSYFDYNLLFILVFLIGFGLVLLYSASSYTAANRYKDAAYFLKLQLRNYAIGTVGMIFFIAVDYRVWKRFYLLIYLLAFVMNFLVFMPGLGTASHGSARWIELGPIQFQPSEVSKIAVILTLAFVINSHPSLCNNLKGIVVTLSLYIILDIPILFTNLSTAIIVIGIAAIMVFVSSTEYKIFIGVIGTLAVLALLFVFTIGYRGTRVQAWLHPEESESSGAFQTLQGLYAIGSGKLFGKGLGESIQKMGKVPESQNDMIFTIICEELGLFGAVCIILLYVLLLWRMMVIANNARDLYGSMIVIGIMSHVALQVVFNIGVVTGILPNTGVTLPFISYGGTSILFLMCEMGLVLSVSRRIRLESIE